MANLIFATDCGDSTGDLTEWSSAFGTVSASTSQPRTGPYSIEIGNSGDTTAGPLNFVRLDSLLADAGRRISAGYYIANAVTGANARILFNVNGTGNLLCFRLGLESTGALTIFNGTTQKSSSASVVSIGSYCRVSLAYVITSTTNYTIKVFVNGTLVLTVTNADFSLPRVGTDAGQFQISAAANSGQTNFLDDFYIDDGTTLDDPGAGSDLRVTRKAPNANGTNNAFDTAVGSVTNRWDAVNEVPVAIGKGWKQAGSSQVIEAYGIQSASQGDVDITGGATILGHKAWIYAKGQDVTTGIPKTTAINNAKATGTTLALGPVTVAAGDIIVVCFGDQVAGTAPTIGDDIGGNTWTPLSGPTTNTARLSKWYCIVTNGGSMTVTVTFGSSANARAGALGVWDSSIFGASPLDANVTNANDSTSPYDCPLSGTLAQTDEIVLGFCSRASNAALSAGALETGIIEAHSSGSGGAGANVSVGLTYRKVTITTSIQPQMTGTSVAGVVGTASFKITPISAGTPQLVDNGSDVAITLTSTPTLYSNHTTSATYPSNGNTTGMKSSGTAMDTYLYECGIQVAYIPGVQAAIPNKVYMVNQAVNRSSMY
jgi:hypothetical protein